jgi:hypothetical protein
MIPRNDETEGAARTELAGELDAAAEKSRQALANI